MKTNMLGQRAISHIIFQWINGAIYMVNMVKVCKITLKAFYQEHFFRYHTTFKR